MTDLRPGPVVVEFLVDDKDESDEMVLGRVEAEVVTPTPRLAFSAASSCLLRKRGT